MEFTYGHAERNSVENHQTKSICARRFERLLLIIYLFIKIIHISKITIIVLSYESYIKLLTRHTLSKSLHRSPKRAITFCIIFYVLYKSASFFIVL